MIFFAGQSVIISVSKLRPLPELFQLSSKARRLLFIAFRASRGQFIEINCLPPSLPGPADS
jgi:hypothetical protein